MEGGRTGILRRMSLDEPSLTVLTSPSQKQNGRCHPTWKQDLYCKGKMQDVKCSPDEWEFCGNVSLQYKQVGNAVLVSLAYDVAKGKYIIHYNI